MQKSKVFEPIDRVALPLIVLLNVLIGFLVMGGDRSRPRVRDFSWQGKVVGATDTAFIFTFSHPMDRASVEANLHIDPPLPGKISWTGRRLVYTLTAPPHYQETYQIKVENGRQSLGGGKLGNPMQPFTSQFRTPARMFAYIGTEKEEKGRLILYNLTRQQKIVLTPKNLVVKDFKPYPAGDRIVFSASDWSQDKPGLFEQSLYRVTTGRNSSETSQPPTQKTGKIERILDNKEYQNLRFDLSADGREIAVQRMNRNNVEEIGLWVIHPDSSLPPQRLLNHPAGEFAIAPDSVALFNPQADGIAILSLAENAKPLDFLPSFRRVFGFSVDGSQSALVKYNSDFSQSLFLLTNQGLKKELIRTTGELLNCQFNPSQPTLYCLLTRRQPGREMVEKLTLDAVDLKTFKVSSLLALPYQWETKMSLSSDGLELVFDRVVMKKEGAVAGDLRTEGGTAIASSNIMLLKLKKTSASASGWASSQSLPVRGFRPRWLP